MANFSGLVVPLATGSGVMSRPLGSGASVRRQAVQDHAAGVAGAVDRLDQVDQLEREGLDDGGLPGNPDGRRGVIAGKQRDVEGETAAGKRVVLVVFFYSTCPFASSSGWRSANLS